MAALYLYGNPPVRTVQGYFQNIYVFFAD